jgi:hypothetical protein
VPIKIAEELHVIASFYRELDDSFGRALATGSYTEAITQIDVAIQFDAMLGGAHADELTHHRNRLLLAVGPE